MAAEKSTAPADSPAARLLYASLGGGERHPAPFRLREPAAIIEDVAEIVLSHARVDPRLPAHGTANSARRILDLAAVGDRDEVERTRARATINTVSRRGRADYYALDACYIASRFIADKESARTARADDLLAFCASALSAVRGYAHPWLRAKSMRAFRAQVAAACVENGAVAARG